MDCPKCPKIKPPKYGFYKQSEMVCLEKIAKMPKILDFLKNDGKYQIKLPIFPPQHALKGT